MSEATQKRGLRKERVGEVVSCKQDKTIVVRVFAFVKIPLIFHNILIVVRIEISVW